MLAAGYMAEREAAREVERCDAEAQRAERELSAMRQEHSGPVVEEAMRFESAAGAIAKVAKLAAQHLRASSGRVSTVLRALSFFCVRHQ